MASRAQTSKVIPNVKSEAKLFVHFIGMLRMKKMHSVNLKSHEERLTHNIIGCRLVRD